MTLPSKELLSIVLCLKRVDDIYIEDNLLYFCTLNKGINIYELVHKCKKWLFNKSYVVTSGLSCKDYPSYEVEYNCIIEDFQSYYEDNKPFLQFFGDTEPEAVFKACEWILRECNNSKKVMGC